MAGFLDVKRLEKLGMSAEQIRVVRANVRNPKYLDSVPKQGSDCMDPTWRQWDR